jgi:hypothetical protein
MSLSAAACSSDDEMALSNADAARTAATELCGGEANEAIEVQEDGYDLWEVEVTMPNSAEIEVLLFMDDGALFEIADKVGPFTYDDLDPLPGNLTYAEARDIAFGEVEGEQLAWEVKFDNERYFYEFYVEESAGQLWEIKLWSDSGEVFTVEAKEEID